MYKCIKANEHARNAKEKRRDNEAVREMLKSEINTLTGQSGNIRSVDPVWYLTDNFVSTFNMTGKSMQEQTPATDGTGVSRESEENQQNGLAQGKEWDFSPHYQASPLQQQNGLFLRKFGQIAFDRGNLAAGILQGRGQLMLMSCMKRTVGQSQPTNIKQEKLFGGSSAHKRLPQKDAQVIFNRNDVKSAVGLVVGSLQSAGRIFSVFDNAANSEGSPLEQESIDTLRQLYPFLSTTRDRDTIERYRMKLSCLKEQGADGEAAGLLERGISKLQAVINKKELMKTQFITKLQMLRYNAAGAEILFFQQGFIDYAFEELKQFAGAADGDGEDQNNGDRNVGPPEEPVEGGTEQWEK